MELQISARPDCPFTAELAGRVSSALSIPGVQPTVSPLPDNTSSSCPLLTINGTEVTSCGPSNNDTACPVCGAMVTVPDVEIIRWHIARALGKKTVLFICSANAVRSQMAEAIVNHCMGKQWAAFSGGILPMQLWPPVVQVLQEIGADASAGRAKHIELFLGCHFDVVMSLCSDTDGFCTAFPGDGVRIHMPFDDPMTNSFFGIGDTARTRKLRDDMQQNICDCLGGIP